MAILQHYLKDDCPVCRNEIMQKLPDAGISSRRSSMTTHRETACKSEYAGLSLPVSEKKSCDRSIILPLYILMSNGDREKVIEAFLLMFQFRLFTEKRSKGLSGGRS